MFRPFRSTENVDDPSSHPASIPERESIAIAGTATSLSQQDFEIVGHKLTYSNVAYQFVDEELPTNQIDKARSSSGSLSPNLSVQAGDLSGSVLDDLPSCSNSIAADGGDDIRPPPKLSISLQPVNIMVEDVCDEDDDGEYLLAPSLLKAALKARKEAQTAAESESPTEAFETAAAIHVNEEPDQEAPSNNRIESGVKPLVLQLPAPPAGGIRVPRKIKFGIYMVLGLVFSMWMSCQVFPDEPAAAEAQPHVSTTSVDNATILDEFPEALTAMIETELEVASHSPQYQEVVYYGFPTMTVVDEVMDLDNEDFFSMPKPTFALMAGLAENGNSIQRVSLPSWVVAVSRMRAVHSFVQVAISWFKWGMVLAIAAFSAWSLNSLVSKVTAPAFGQETPVVRVIKNESVRGESAMQCGWPFGRAGATTVMTTTPFLEQERNLTNLGELCDFLSVCDSQLSRSGRRSRAAPLTPRLAYDTSAYERLTKKELVCIGKGLGASDLSVASNKATLIGVVVPKYEAELRGFTMSMIKEVLTVKNIQPAARAKKNDLVQLAVEAAF